MRNSLALLAAGIALLAVPALAQLNPDGVANVNLVGQLGAKPGGVVSKLTSPVDDANLTLATREQVRAGAEIYDTRGNSVGTVQSIDGDNAVVVRGGKLYNVPLSGIYHGAVGKTHGLVTKLSDAEIQARTTAAAESR